MMSQRPCERVLDGAGKMAGDAIDESVLEAAGAPVVLAQFDGHVNQHAFDEDALTRRPHMPDSFIGVTLAPQVVGLTAVAGLDRPEINPGDNGRIVVPTGEGAKGRKLVRVS